MATFKAGGREWSIEINPWQFRRVRDALGVELKNFAADGWKPLFETLADAEKFVDLLYCLCLPQIEAAKVSMEDFLKSLAGDEYEAAAHALVKAFADFYPSQSRSLLLALTAKATQVQTLAAKTALEKMEAVTPEDILATLKHSAGSTPESSASTPTS